MAVDEAEKIVNHWFIDYPIEPDFQSRLFSSEGSEALGYESEGSWKSDLWTADLGIKNWRK